MEMVLPEVPLLQVLLVALLGVFLPIWGILDAATRPDNAWIAADQSKMVWVVVQLFLWTIGTIAYLIVVRPKLKARADPGNNN